MQYKNLDITPGLPVIFHFELLDINGVKLNLNGYTFKLDILNSNKEIILSKVTPDVVSLGLASFGLNAVETSKIKGPVSTYSLVVTSSASFGTLSYKGFLASQPGVFNANDFGTGVSTVLPDGSIYATGPITVAYDSWYAIATYFRFMVTGVGVLVADGRDIRGTVYPNLSVYSSTSPTEERWIPDFSGMTAFRVKKVSGSVTTRYLP